MTGLYTRVTALLCCGVLVASVAIAEDRLQQAIDQQSAVNQANKASQSKVDKLADKAQQLLQDYRNTLREADNLRQYNDNLEKLITSQQAEVASLNKQLGEIDSTNQGIVPLMLRMVDTLEKFIELDLPFLLNERRDRVTTLKALLVDANITTSEKFRRVMEAYQVEAEYGRTIEAYQGTLQEGGNNRTVDFLRIGRLTLVYQTIDGAQSYVWDKQAKTWSALDSDYAAQIRKGMRIAKKQAAPELLTLPVNAGKAGGS